MLAEGMKSSADVQVDFFIRCRSRHFLSKASGRCRASRTSVASSWVPNSLVQQPLLNKRTSAPRADYARISYNARMHRIVKKDDAIDYWALFSALQRYNKA